MARVKSAGVPAAGPAAEPRPSGVPVPCCQCGEPTSMRVPAEALEDLQIFHLCPVCAKPERAARKPKPAPPAAPAG